MTKDIDPLVDRVAKAIADGFSSADRAQDEHRECACAAIRAVLSHFSEPGNVTKEMRSAAFMYGATVDWSDVGVIASAMRAALDDLKEKDAGE